jgi:uncharacterized membrane protein
VNRANDLSGRWFRGALRRIEIDESWDSAVERLEAPARVLRSRPRIRSLLRGDWLGHALHPLMTDFPLGTWMSASLLDIMGRGRFDAASEHLLRFGVLAAVPTALAGLAELPEADREARRVAVVHASVNSSALALYAASLVARRRKRWTLGMALGIAGGVTATVGGYFGGHLSFVRGVGVEGGSAPPSEDETPLV